MDEDNIAAEETDECQDCREVAERAVRESARVNAELIRIKNNIICECI